MYGEDVRATIDVSTGSQHDRQPNLSENLEFWMSRLPPRLQALPFTQLAIPGSHNSMTYTIKKNEDVGPDEPAAIRALGRYASIFAKPLIFNWSINQKENVREQLNGGIRYLDLRVASKASDDNIYFLHGLYGAEVSVPLQEVANWLEVHPNEVIVLDFQHFYDLTEEQHEKLIGQVKYLFRGKICPVYSKFANISLQWLRTERYQVFVVYRNLIARNYNDLWPTGLWPTPWPNTVSTSKLVAFLDNGLQNRERDLAFVSQCLLTPDSGYVFRHICGSLERNLCSKCRGVTLAWVAEHCPGSGGMNIVITDYVSFDNFLFSRSVIQQNALLLKEQSYYSSALHIKA